MKRHVSSQDYAFVGGGILNIKLKNLKIAVF